jgi:hypothetical protein
MPLSKEQREAQSYRMFCYHHKDLLMKIMKHPELERKVKHLIDEYRKNKLNT